MAATIQCLRMWRTGSLQNVLALFTIRRAEQIGTSPATGAPVAPLHRFDWVSASPCCTRLTWWAELPGRVTTSLEFAPVSIRRKLEAQSRPHAKRRSALILDRASANWLMSYFVHIKERYLRNEKFNENKE